MHTTTSGFFFRQDDQSKFSRSRSIRVSDSIDIIFVCHHPDHAIIDLIDHNFTNVFVTFSSQTDNIDASFTSLLEDLNREMSQIQLRQSLEWLSLFVGIVQNGYITFSVLWEWLQGLLIGPDNVDDVLDGMSADNEIRFVYDSRGQVTDKEALVIIATDLLALFSIDEIQDLSNVTWSKRIAIIDERIRASNGQINTAYAMVGYDNSTSTVVEDQEKYLDTTNKKPAWTSVGAFVGMIMWGCKKFTLMTRRYFVSLPDNAQYAVFWVSILIALILLWMVISSAMGRQKEIFVPQEYEAMYEQAVVSVNNAINSTGNPEAFQQHIVTARNLLNTIEDAWVLKAKVGELNLMIASKEKQFNQITTLSSYQIQEQYTFAPDENILALYVYEWQQYYVSETQIVGPHIQWSTPEIHQVPETSKILFSDIWDDGKIYLYTEDQQILVFYKGNFNTLEVKQVDGWDLASDMQVYNQNIYLLSSDRKQIYKHRRVGTQYDGKTLMVQESASDFWFAISDFDIDGGFYILKDNTLVDKIFSAPKYERRSIVLNNLGTNIFRYDEAQGIPQKIVGEPSVDHVFILLNGKIWIFEPNSKRFSDVKSLYYIGQLEIPNVDVVNAWFVQSWVVTEAYVLDNTGSVSRIKMTIQDGSIEVNG